MKNQPIMILAMVILLLSNVGGETDFEKPVHDRGLRAFLSISSYSCNVEVPSGTIAYICKIAKFESGEFKFHGGFHNSPWGGEQPLFVELVWGPFDGSSAWAIATSSSHSGRKADSFSCFQNIKTAGWSRRAPKDLKTNQEIFYEGYQVLGVVVDDTGDYGVGPTEDIESYLESFDHAVVLQVKFFKDHDSYRQGIKEMKDEILKAEAEQLETTAVIVPAN
jgi:hypothetical protein